MNINKQIFINTFFVLSFLVLNLKGQVFHKMLSQDGEANLSVRNIIQDDNGFLWIATFSGLYRYEGDDYIIKHQFNNNKEINSDVTSLIKDNENNIWIGTDKGLSKYNLTSEELVTYLHQEGKSSSLVDNRIRCLSIDKKGNIWVGTKEGGLCVYSHEKDSFTPIMLNVSEDTSPLYVKSILNASDGKIWIGTFQNGVYCFSYSGSMVDSVCNYRTENSAKNLSHNYVYCIYEDYDGTIAIGTRNGINIFDPTSKTMKEYYLRTPNLVGGMTNFIRSINRDNSGKLWIGTWGGLILCDNFSDIETGNYKLVLHDRKNNTSISHDQIMHVFQDRSGIVWISTENGLNNYDPYQNQFQQLKDNVLEEMMEQTATVFSPYREGLLIATLSHGIIYKNQKDAQLISVSKQIEQSGEKIYSLFVDSKNNIWAGSYNGFLLKINTLSNSLSWHKHSKNKVPIYAISELEDGKIILGTSGEGLKYFNPNTEQFSNDNGLSGDLMINDVLLDNNDNLWVAAEQGIFRKKVGNNTFEYYLPDNPDKLLNPNIFNDLVVSENGEIFVGGRNGLYKYNEPTNIFNVLDFENTDKLWVTNIQIDSEQNIWLNLNFNRIAKWEPASSLLRFFNVNNGIRSSQYNKRGFYIDENNVLYLSGFDQIYKFNTSAPVLNKFSPVPVFTRLIINNADVNVDGEVNNQIILKQNINKQGSIKLSHLNKDFTLAFTTTSYLGNIDNKYRYKLHGYDKQWHEGDQKVARYTNLSSGRYIFEVYSANNDGHWSSNSAKLKIRVRPAPLLSWWAILLYVVVITIAIYQIRKYIIVRIRLKQELLIERVKRDKEEKFHEERLRFYTNISHELRTPLTLILGPIKQLIGQEKEGTKNSRLHQLILNNSQRLLSLVNQLLDYRKSLHQGMKLKVTNSNIVDIVESNISAFDYMAKEKTIITKFTSENKHLMGWFDMEKLDIILFNILSNAYKYTPEYGFVDVDLKISPSNKFFQNLHVEMKVSNSGAGIQKNLQEKVFERFYQVNDSSKSPNTGTGIGLALVKTLVELHHGKITLESDPGKTTCFTIFLPLEKESFSDEEIFDFTRDADRRTKELIKFSEGRRSQENEVFDKINRKAKIVVVEDNYELREYLSDYLSEEYHVFIANDGVEGIKVCENENIDLVISDVMMDNMDGYEFCKNLKSNPEISHIPVILMTALASFENKIEGYKTGADDYITKPFEPELLKIRAKNILTNLEKLRIGFKKDMNISVKELTLSKLDEDLLNKAIQLIADNMEDPDFNKDILCREMGMSYSYLYRKLKGITGTSPSDFIQTYRLKKAAQLLTEGNLNISEVAYKVGYNDALYFSKCFKKQFGTSPSNF